MGCQSKYSLIWILSHLLMVQGSEHIYNTNQQLVQSYIDNGQTTFLVEDAQFLDAKYEASEFKDLSNLKVWLTGALHNHAS